MRGSSRIDGCLLLGTRFESTCFDHVYSFVCEEAVESPRAFVFSGTLIIVILIITTSFIIFKFLFSRTVFDDMIRAIAEVTFSLIRMTFAVLKLLRCIGFPVSVPITVGC